MSDIKTKFINDPEQITPELLEGYVLAYPDQVKLGGENIVVRANPKSEDKVAIVTLGGSGHEPALSGFVGEGMLDCSVVGDIFAAPGAQRLFQALQLMKREAGILLVVLNHSGDVMSANMACQLAERVGIKVKQVLTHDDISAGIGADINDRRGLAGCVPLYKILGAAAEEGKTSWSKSPNAITTTSLLWPLPCALVRIRRTAVRSPTCPRASWRSVWDSTAKAVADRNRLYLPTIRLPRW